MASDEILIATAVALYVKSKSKKRSRWTKDWLQKRGKYSHINLLEELRLEPRDWMNYLRMDSGTYEELLCYVAPLIIKNDTVMRAAITPHERLTATLRLLATGRNFEDMKFSVIISPQALSQIIPETCRAIITVLKDQYMKFPNTEDEWKQISKEFNSKWQFPNCIGALDGKHINIVAPKGSGSYYFNYKKRNSIVLMAIANANYEFIMCDIGTNGRVSDGGVIRNTKFYEKLLADTLKIPKVANGSLPYVFVADEAFSLRPDMLKPFSQRELNYERKIFNYRLSRARRIIENVFGILAARFRIFHTEINLKLETTEIVTLCCCILHNFLRIKCTCQYMPPEVTDQDEIENGTVIRGLASDGIFDHLQRTSRNMQSDAKEARQKFLEYFNGDGAVEWQDRMIAQNG